MPAKRAVCQLTLTRKLNFAAMQQKWGIYTPSAKAGSVFRMRLETRFVE